MFKKKIVMAIEILFGNTNSEPIFDIQKSFAKLILKMQKDFEVKMINRLSSWQELLRYSSIEETKRLVEFNHHFHALSNTFTEPNKPLPIVNIHKSTYINIDTISNEKIVIGIQQGRDKSKALLAYLKDNESFKVMLDKCQLVTARNVGKTSMEESMFALLVHSRKTKII